MRGSRKPLGLPAGQANDHGKARCSVAPSELDPILALAEAVDRRRRHIRPIRRDGLLGLELGRHHGRFVRLSDGSVVPTGAPVGYLHLRNDRVRALATNGWQLAGYRAGRADLVALAHWWGRQPVAERPVAFTATTILGPFIRRDGWPVTSKPSTLRARLDQWWMSWLMVHFGHAGRERLTRLHHRLDLVEVWLSASELVARYGKGPLAGAPDPSHAREPESTFEVSMPDGDFEPYTHEHLKQTGISAPGPGTQRIGAGHADVPSRRDHVAHRA